MTFRPQNFLFYLLIATSIVAIFFPILSYRWMGLEDPSYYQTNPLFGQAPLLNRLLAAWFHSPEFNYIPLTWNLTTLLAEFTQGSPRAFHAFSLALHLSCCGLAFTLLSRLGLKKAIAAFVVLLFALHPLRIESVAWASSIKGLLATLFALAALLVQTYPKLRLRTSLIVLFFLCSLLSKQTLLLLPAVLFLISAANSELRLTKFSYLPLAALSLIGAFAASRANLGNTLTAINQLHDGPIAPLKALSAFGHYLKQQFIPWPLFPEYPSNQDPTLLIIGLIGLIPVGFLTKNICQSKRPPLSSVFFATFFILLFPTLGLITTPLEFAADRLTYLPSLFFWAAAATLLTERFPSLLSNRIAQAISLLLLIPFITLTTRQLSYWKNENTLTHHILSQQPDHYLANLNLANRLGLQSQFQKALPYAQTLIQEHPHRYGGWKTFSEVNIQLGQAHTTLQKIDHALAQSTPITGDLHLLRCDSLLVLGQYQKALTSNELARTNGIDDLTFHYTRARIYLAANLLQKAKQEIDKAHSLNPQSPEVIALKSKINTRK